MKFLRNPKVLVPYYHCCTELLKKSLKKFNENEDIIGIIAAIEKLEHYYVLISPIAGIDSLGWLDDWIRVASD